jgi:pyrimidine-specific ribonucleoside hydrolase
MKRTLFILIGLTLSLSLLSHPWKPNHYVIIDTDGGIDDIRAITMLLASPDVRVLAITVSPGVLDAGNAYKKVKSLLNSFYHEGIPVGINRMSKFRSPDFPLALNTIWGDESYVNMGNIPDCIRLISDIISAERTMVSFICLGSLSTVSSAITEIPLFRQQVKEIIWSVDDPDEKGGFNYQTDVSSAEKVLKSNIRLKKVCGTGDVPYYNSTLLKSISGIRSIYAAKITGFFSSVASSDHNYSYAANDEMTVLFLHYPELFKNDSITDKFFSSPSNIDSLRQRSLKILAGETVATNQVIKFFPDDPSFYFPDVEPYVSEIIKKYGKDEWISGVIANELHRHLGVFAIVGVKMGIRAREFFDTGVDEFSAVSFAGSIPPLSCMNDGIQVSTGSTPGHGLLTVKNDTRAIPSVEFTYMNRKIRLTLKPGIADKISTELREINFVYGLDSNIYWELVRKNTIKYWSNLDRHEIFDIDVIQ